MQILSKNKFSILLSYIVVAAILPISSFGDGDGDTDPTILKERASDKIEKVEGKYRGDMGNASSSQHAFEEGKFADQLSREALSKDQSDYKSENMHKDSIKQTDYAIKMHTNTRNILNRTAGQGEKYGSKPAGHYGPLREAADIHDGEVNRFSKVKKKSESALKKLNAANK